MPVVFLLCIAYIEYGGLRRPSAFFPANRSSHIRSIRRCWSSSREGHLDSNLSFNWTTSLKLPRQPTPIRRNRRPSPCSRREALRLVRHISNKIFRTSRRCPPTAPSCEVVLEFEPLPCRLSRSVRTSLPAESANQ